MITPLRSFFLGAILIFLFELLSLYAFLLPLFGSIAFFIILALVSIIAILRFDLAVLLLFVELVVGSQGGYMIAFGESLDSQISLRIGFFVVIFGVWMTRLLYVLFKKDITSARSLLLLDTPHIFYPYVALLFIFMVGVVRGILHGHSFSDIFFDANGYAYFALFPAVISSLKVSNLFPRYFLSVLCAAIFMAVLKSLFILFVFSHRMFTIAPTIYSWVRDTRVGEITLMTSDFYRVFFQSQIFSLVLLFFVLMFALLAQKRRITLVTVGFLFIIAVSMLLSLSRSFWFGAVVGFFTLVVLLWRSGYFFSVWKKLLIISFGVTISAGICIAGVYAFPYPKKTGDISFTSFLTSRAFSISDDAANSRWALLPPLTDRIFERPLFGSGLGASVTYKASDPRILAIYPSGLYTTTAFEWGYQDLALKFGFLGLGIYGFFLYRIIQPFYRKRYQSIIALSAIPSFITLLAVHIFSPYLNHPLGIGILMLFTTLGLVLTQDSINEGLVSE